MVYKRKSVPLVHHQQKPLEYQRKTRDKALTTFCPPPGDTDFRGHARPGRCRKAGLPQINAIQRSESLSGAEGTLVALQVYSGFYGPYRGLNERGRAPAAHTALAETKTPYLARQRLEHEKQKTPLS
nr:MAG TPA: hypothetical protein [Caudoviricetes sp.]